MNDRGRAAGRSGLGAVMGSKRLKAIAARGKGLIPLFDARRATELRKTYLSQLTGTIGWMKEHGTAFVAASSAHNGDAPVRNWGGVGYFDFPDIDEFDAEKITARRARRYGCFKCPIGCGAHMRCGDRRVCRTRKAVIGRNTRRSPCSGAIASTTTSSRSSS